MFLYVKAKFITIMASPNVIKLTTETERLLYKRFEEEKRERIQLENLVSDLKNQIQELQRHLQHMKEKEATSSTQKNPSPAVNYETDEEELAKETDWIRQINRKKRRLNKSPSPVQDESHDEAQKQKQKVKKPPQPPPIVVENVKDYQKFYDLLTTSLSRDSFLVKMMSGDSVKISTYDEESYRSATKLLLQNNCRWYSYENKQERPIRVMAKNLHSSCLPNNIIEDLKLHGYKCLEAVNKLSWRDKEPLNMFMLSFEKDEDIKKIYNIKSVLGCKVEIQAVKTSKLIPQCKRCQAYGHTQKYCAKEPRCVKCAGKDLTKNCTKPQ